MSTSRNIQVISIVLVMGLVNFGIAEQQTCSAKQTGTSEGDDCESEETNNSFKYPFPNCPTPKLPPMNGILLNKFLGTWFFVRATLPMDIDCMADTYWIDSTAKEPSSVVNGLVETKVNGSVKHFVRWEMDVKHLSDGRVDNYWTFNLVGGNVSVPGYFVGTDEGHSWAIWHACMSLDPATSDAPFWFILSRTRSMDSKLEQTLVEKVEEYSGITSDKLRGMSQTDCY